MRFGVKTDKGMIREINEDSYNIIAGYSGVPVSFIVADGMGGHNSGEIASKMAVDFVSNYILQYPEGFSIEEEIEGILIEIANKANAYIYNKAKEDEANSGMGTTLIIAVVSNKHMYIAHIGDSRVYLIRDNQINRITTDHSFIEELIKGGSLTREEAENHPKRNIITRALGCIEEVEVDTYSCEINDDDIFLLCTDGLTNMLSEEEINGTLREIDNPEIACNELVRMANEKGGDDNISVIVVKS